MHTFWYTLFYRHTHAHAYGKLRGVGGHKDIELMEGGDDGEGIGGEYSQSIWNSWMGMHLCSYHCI